MRGIIDNIIGFYELQAKALSILAANTQKALKELDGKRKANEQIQRVENFVKDLTMNLNNMLAKFHFLKERKNRKQEQLTEGQTKAVAEFAIFVKTLTKNVSSLLKRFEQSRSFEEKIDKEIKELEASIGRKLQEFDKALEETTNTSAGYLINFVRSIISSFARLPRVRNIVLAVANRKKLDRPLKESSQNIENYQVEIPNPCDSQLENLCNSLNINSVNGSRESSKNLMHLRA